METVDLCPVCRTSEFISFLTVPDHFLTHEVFTIQQCKTCGLKFVNPRPKELEMAKYYQTEDYISHNSQKGDFISKLYRIARGISVRRKHRMVTKYTHVKKLLDIGCGTGYFLQYCMNKGIEVFGLEPNPMARSFARDTNKLTVFKDLDELGEEANFNCITMWHVVEHIHSLNDTLSRIKKLLKSDGVLIVAFPNCNSWDAKKYKQFWAAYDVPRHLYHFNASSFTELVKNHGWGVTAILPQKLDAYYISLLSEKYRNGKPNYIKAFYTGLRSNFMAGIHGSGTSSLIFILAPQIS